MNVTNTLSNLALFNIRNLKTHNSPIKKENTISFKGQPESDCFVSQTPLSIKTDFGTINYSKDKSFSNIEFKKPLSLKEAFTGVKHLQDEYKIHKYGLATYGYAYKSFVENFSEEFKDMKFTKYLGAGNRAFAFENEEGNVLKLSEYSHFPFDRPVEDFDASVTIRGKCYYIHEKCSRENITQKHVDIMTKRIEEKGYEAFDMSVDQIGFDKNGKLVLLDPECARDAEKQKLKRKQIEEWYIKNGLDYDYI